MAITMDFTKNNDAKMHETTANTIIHTPYVISKIDDVFTRAKRPDRYGTRPRQRQFFVGRGERILKKKNTLQVYDEFENRFATDDVHVESYTLFYSV